MRYAIGLLAALALPAIAQTNVTPQTESWLEANVEVDVRLIGPPTATNLAPTVKLIPMKFTPLGAKNQSFSVPCWNKTSPCPQVVGVTVQVFLQLPTGRSNITRFTGLCGTATTCKLPDFPAIQAKPGEFYHFNYSRINAAWNVPPTVVSAAVVPPPPPPASTTSPNGTTIPPAAEIVDANKGVWTLGAVVNGKQRQILLNGKVVGDHAERLEISAKGIFAWNSNNGYSMWSGTTWVGGTP